MYFLKNVNLQYKNIQTNKSIFVDLRIHSPRFCFIIILMCELTFTSTDAYKKFLYLL